MDPLYFMYTAAFLPIFHVCVLVQLPYTIIPIAIEIKFNLTINVVIESYW
ncbi:hypothetical protein GKZ28_18645 [Clostridium chromiireducens]|uniref:Uncharacterized protein n=1 Tax=Clostridium chromiireducens TaxID=225345 RepID=A0A964RQ25_9CLOT|nr:hypothetical protein [Clostridium chromiireducens]MVX65702.1 hypothetical protein [Clostridium chromiireducens]